MFINNLAYEASAGSGKTFMLVVRYLSLLFKGAQPSKILALTFTNKAANEMQERIVATLEELECRGELDEIVKVTELSSEYLLANRKRVLGEFLNSHTRIMTIDSFFTQILRKFSLYASLMPDFSTFSSPVPTTTYNTKTRHPFKSVRAHHVHRPCIRRLTRATDHRLRDGRCEQPTAHVSQTES